MLGTAHRYKFVMKMRTDMNLYGPRPLYDLYRSVVPNFGERSAFMSSDRFFGGARNVSPAL